MPCNDILNKKLLHYVAGCVILRASLIELGGILMRRVAEIMYIIPEEREQFLKGALHPDERMQKVLWACGVRNQQYYGMNGLIFMTFEYEGSSFAEDMKMMASELDKMGHLVTKRRKDVPVVERATTNWWAPVKRLGVVMTESPFASEEEKSKEEEYLAMVDGSMSDSFDITFDQKDWTEDFHF